MKILPYHYRSMIAILKAERKARKTYGLSMAIIAEDTPYLDIDYVKGGPNPKGKDMYRGTV